MRTRNFDCSFTRNDVIDHIVAAIHELNLNIGEWGWSSEESFIYTLKEDREFRKRMENYIVEKLLEKEIGSNITI